MRLRSSLLSFALLGFGSSVAAAYGAGSGDLLSIANATKLNAEVPTYVGKLEVLLKQHGQSCDSISHINAYSTGDGLRTVVACNNGAKTYEIVFEGQSVTVTAAN